ncbi:MAG TPA: PIG-L family deacetylase [Chitinophagaceae bacterium]|nr:PIG-L family deacetylase [Chitinophagaceae bacterium]
MTKILVSLLISLLSVTSFAQAPVSWSSADMYQAIRKLNVLGSVLYIAAHPDDENTRLIAYLSKDRLLRTGYLSMTRGDGGQNLIGDEQGIELGMIRTQELLAARRTDGGEQFFTRAFDFGYSKTPEETFSKWDKEKILSDVVWVIRKFKPDVIVTRFPTTGEGGHGHHTASAILANEAFDAAADPNRFPEQLQYVKTWRVKRVLWNTFNFGGNNTIREDQLKIDVGGYNALLGKSYGEIAAESRSQHKSQGFGVPASRGEQLEYFKATKGDQPKADLMEGVNMSWKKINDGAAIEKMINDVAAGFDLLHPENSVDKLVKLYQAMKSLEPGYWKDKKMEEVKTLIQQCSGLFIDVTTNEQFAVQTDSVRFDFSFNNRLGVGAKLLRVQTDTFDSTFTVPLGKNQNFNFSQVMYVSPEKPVTQPYWLSEKMNEGSFNVRDQRMIGQPDVSPAYTVTSTISINGESFRFDEAVKYKHTDPVKGEVYQPLVVTPPVLVNPDKEIIITKGNNEFEGILNLTGLKKGFSTEMGDVVALNGNDKPTIQYQPRKVSFNEKGKTIPVSYSLTASADNEYMFAASASNGRNDWYHLGKKEIRYDHIPAINYFKIAEVSNKRLNLEIYNQKIGYIVGAGDKVPEGLEQMGYEVTLLTEKELARNNLQQYDAIITGVRAYNTNEWMGDYYSKLMKYVEEGGNLIVQYNTRNFISSVTSNMGPYDFSISRTRVTDENAPVTFLKPDHPVLNFPNKITQDDFKGWIQERSIYHAERWDKDKYETILAMNDAGEKPDEGSLIIAKYGKGYFTYTGLVFFRELPAGVPGAYRLLANIIALNKKKGF